MGNLKDIYSRTFYKNLGNDLEKVIPNFSTDEFQKKIFNNDFDFFELKDRMKHTAIVMNSFLAKDYRSAILQIKTLINVLKKDRANENRLAYIFLPEYIYLYGLDDVDNSIDALEFVTQFISCEFAVRPFIIKYPDILIPQLLTWSKHPSNAVRRLASEGSRPRLPWAMALPFLKANPLPILPILENLKNDTCEIVRRSVANNLNDISKDNPEVVLNTANKWYGKTAETNALIKHSLRTLLKQSNAETLKFYGLDNKGITISNFSIINKAVKIGEYLEFNFDIENTNNIHKHIRLEYAIYYLKNNNNLNKKVFKISERTFKPLEKNNINRKQSFKIISTRKFYYGEHKVSLIINGKEYNLLDFNLEF